MWLSNINPSSFFSRSRVVIRDEKGKIFYFHPNEEKTIVFNLPRGKFYSEGSIERLAKFYPYDLIPLPSYDKKDFKKGNKVRTGNNKNKATITKSKRSILLDTTISDCSYIPVKRFVLGHELGHHLFNEEELCDQFSYNLMMVGGYNPSQIKIAKHFLFKNNPNRKGCISHAINSVAKRR